MALELKTTCNTAVEHYHALRPSYPPELFIQLIATAHLTKESRLLEIGPGTGQATKPLAERGYQITAIELGNELADKARQILAPYSNVAIVTGAFEDVVLKESYYDLVYSATAIHWIHPEVRFVKPYTILKSGGFLAIIHTEHVSDEMGDTFFYKSEPIYRKYHSADKPISKQGDHSLPRLINLRPPEKIDTALFSLENFTVFPMSIAYTSQEYCDLLATYSPHLALSEKKRAGFLQEIKALIDSDFTGHMTKHYGMTLTLVKKV